MGPLAGIVAALTLIAYVGLTGGAVRFLFGDEPPADEYAAANQQWASDYERALLTIERQHPLPYSATTTQYGPGIDEPRTRFYVAKSVRESE